MSGRCGESGASGGTVARRGPVRACEAERGRWARADVVLFGQGENVGLVHSLYKRAVLPCAHGQSCLLRMARARADMNNHLRMPGNRR